MAHIVSEKRIDSKLETAIIGVYGDSDWQVNDFTNLLNFIDKCVCILEVLPELNSKRLNEKRDVLDNENFIEYFTKIEDVLQSLLFWSREVSKISNSTNPENYFIEKAYEGIDKIYKEDGEKYLINLDSLNSHQKWLLNFKEFKESERLIKEFIFQSFPNNSIRIIKLKINSPVEALFEIPKIVANQTNDLLNTVLYYQKKKKQLELEIDLKSIEKDDKNLEYQAKLQQFEIKKLNEDLLQSVSIIKNLAELKNSMKEIGASEEDATRFVQQWLLDRIDIIFPNANKINSIALLKE